MYRVENGECLEDRRLSQLWILCKDRRFKTVGRLDLRFCRRVLHQASIVDTKQAIARPGLWGQLA